MIECYKTDETGTTSLISEPETGCWVNVVSPTPQEKEWVQSSLGVVPEFIRSALDEEESPHTDYDDDTGQTMIILDCASIEDAREVVDTSIVQYDTQPLSFVIIPQRKIIVTMSLHPNDTVTYLTTKRLATIDTRQRTRLVLVALLHISQQFLKYLRSIHRQFTKNERELQRTMRNRELIKMLGFEKSLVYFSTSLNADETVLTRIETGRVLKLYEEDQDLLDDVLIEMRQAAEMCSIYTDIINGITETFSSVISNNLNLTMRTLTMLALILAIPTIIFSFYGMNVENLPFIESWIVPLIIAIAGCGIALLVMWRTHFFR
ncbi:MAG: magnesium transporter CorA family protein [Eggerthellaceae bacterium]|jgi:magnesium transporter